MTTFNLFSGVSLRFECLINLEFLLEEFPSDFIPLTNTIVPLLLQVSRSSSYTWFLMFSCLFYVYFIPILYLFYVYIMSILCLFYVFLLHLFCFLFLVMHYFIFYFRPLKVHFILYYSVFLIHQSWVFSSWFLYFYMFGFMTV